ncbi:hypothetical protein EYF80_065398 [Liparis tanakae]|uniref:Uncharacterized protein n=1 Tax=Liparis tanakae TaxID=230148 RepID=A0A4Z2E6C7_9TELE|nr:hypothetical protein EYF80_065398 [Liparis tanakae]
MSGKERSPRHRPWSVYRANTFDLAAEMMGLALSGNSVTATMVTGSTTSVMKGVKRRPLTSPPTGSSQDPDEPVLEFSVGELTRRRGCEHHASSPWRRRAEHVKSQFTQ